MLDLPKNNKIVLWNLEYQEMRRNKIREKVMVSLTVMYVQCVRNQAWQHNFVKGQRSITMKIA